MQHLKLSTRQSTWDEQWHTILQKKELSCVGLLEKTTSKQQLLLILWNQEQLLPHQNQPLQNQQCALPPQHQPLKPTGFLVDELWYVGDYTAKNECTTAHEKTQKKYFYVLIATAMKWELRRRRGDADCNLHALKRMKSSASAIAEQLGRRWKWRTCVWQWLMGVRGRRWQL